MRCVRTGGCDGPTSASSACRRRLDERWVERTGRRRALRVAEVVTGSPAAASGIQPGDLIIAIDGTPLADAQSLQRLMFEDAIGRRTEITVLRNGAMVDVVTEPAELVD